MGSAMEPLCEFCRMVRAVVYCKSDLARLCLQCDGSVHSANALSRRHPRSLLCDRCNSQPAVVRCMYDKMSLCQGCDCNASSGCSGLGHQRQTLTCYTGCPSLAEFSTIWAFVLDAPFSNGFDHNWRALAALPLNENCVNKILEPTDSEGSVGLVASKMNDLETCPNKIEPWLASSVIPPNPNFTASSCRNQAPLIPEEPNLPKGSNLGLPGGDELGKGIDVEDIALTFDSADEIFGCSQGQPNPRYQLEDVGMDCLLMEKNLSATGSNGPIENALEASSSGPQDCMAFQSSPVGGGSVMQAANASNYNLLLNPSCSRSTGLGFPTGQVHSSISLSLSNITGENSAADYQDCGLSPLFMTSESPWESNLEVSCPQARDKAKMRYNEKKKTRTFGKQIRYASRKARADTRKRVKGRFVKVGEAYDYDPLVTRNC